MSWWNPGKGYENSQKELEKYYQQAQGGLQPYNQNGMDAYTDYNQAMKDLMDPQKLYDKWASGYQESDAAKQNEAMASQHGLDAASSMGLMGSSPALQAIQSGTSGIVAQDRQQYLDDLMKKYMSGVGIGQDIYGQGANAAGQQSQNSMNMGQNSAQNAFGQENARGSMINNLIGTAGGVAGGYFGNRGWNTTGGKK